MIGITARSGPARPRPTAPPGTTNGAGVATPLRHAVASHGVAPERGRERTPRSSTDHGRFGRMFRSAPVYEVPQDELRELGARMAGPATPDVPLGTIDPAENAAIPAGYTYLAQFLDHDITFDPVSSLERQHDPDALRSFRTPRLDLDAVYGRGPADQPYLYADDDPAKLRLGAGGEDLPRFGDVAVIGDPRNDENRIISQLHVAFLRFHNAVVDAVRDEGGLAPGDVLAETQRRVRWHYQWVILNDLLPRLCGEDVMHDVLRREEFVVTTGWTPDPAPPNPADPGHPVSSTTEVVRPRLRFYAFDRAPFIPVEFSAAAYRFGHSMVRQSYVVNDELRERTGGRTPLFSDSTEPDANLNGHRALPPGGGVDWRHFFRAAGADVRPQPSMRIDDRLSPPLARLQGTDGTALMRSLATRNLLRGEALGVPSGQAVARAMSLDPLPPSRLGLEALPALERHTPLWYYVLREAGELCQGCCLGPVGGRIVAETVTGLVAGDPLSYLRVEPGWTPTLPFSGDTFRMADLLAVAQQA